MKTGATFSWLGILTLWHFILDNNLYFYIFNFCVFFINRLKMLL